MWLRFADVLRCPLCRGPLVFEMFEGASQPLAPAWRETARRHGLSADACTVRAEAGVLLCEPCRVLYPVFRGLPVMLPYPVRLHAQFAEAQGQRLARYARYEFPRMEPPRGEQAVMDTFSREWLDYDYDGVIWEMSYEDHERRLLQELGPALPGTLPGRFLEVGCGLGLSTWLAHKNSGMDAVGLDLSLAVLKASRHYRDHPFLHFVQASVFAPPFAPESFEVVYSRGVLHHTVSTQSAFQSAASLCRRGGTLYVWVYGTGSIRETLFRRAVHGLERAVRPRLSASPDSRSARAFLLAMGAGYMLFNRMRRVVTPQIQPLTLSRGVHAARDRFTPRYAHRHEPGEVTEWFRQADYHAIEVLDWRAMPAADHDDYRRNVGVRAVRGVPGGSGPPC